MQLETRPPFGMYMEKGFYWRQEMESLKRRLEHLEKRTVLPGNLIDQNSFSYMLAENVTAVVGLRETIVSKHWFVKVLWAILFFVGIVITIYYLVKSILEFTQYPVGTKISLIAPADYPPPLFKLCIDGWIDPVKAANTGLSVHAVRYGLGYTLDAPSIGVGDINLTKTEFETFYRQRNFSNVDDYYSSVAYEPVITNDLTHNLSLGTRPMFYCDGCRLDYGLETSFVYQKGLCYRFSLEPVRNDPLKQLNGGIIVEIGTPRPSIVARNISFWNLYVEPDNTTLFPKAVETSMILREKVNVVSVSRNVIRRLSTGDRPCEEKDEWKTFRCVTACISEMLRPWYNCTLYLSRWQTQQDIREWCNIYSMGILAASATGNNSLVSNLQEDTTICSRNCTLSCTTNIYQMVSQTLEEPPTIPVLNPDVTFAEIRLSDTATLIGVLLFEEYYTYSFDSFIGNVGGTLGLFFGATLYTFFQLILTFVEYYLTKHPTTVLPQRNPRV